MRISPVDLSIILLFLAFSLIVGVWASRKNKNIKDYFAAGGNMPWWLLGVSMVATTFSTDTPNLVTDIVRQHGVSGNWVWWAFLLTGMLTVFVYSALWKKSGVMTDVEFYEIRYSGTLAKFLRGFRALYLGLIFNVVIMATVTLAAIKILGILLGFTPIQTVLLGGSITVLYSMLGGLRGVVLTDFFQFILSLGGAIVAAYFTIKHPMIGDLPALFSHEKVIEKLSFFPSFSTPELLIGLFLFPILVQWWSSWYPGSEPGGGGYIAQRMIAARNADHAVKSVLFFNIAHYALRPWPWIIVALGSLIVYPDLASLSLAFPDMKGYVGHDLAYSAMLQDIPTGWKGLILTSLIAAYMSTISTHLNWGASYLVSDVYIRFIDPNSSEKKQIIVSRLITLLLMVFAMLLALQLQNALSAFTILLQIGAGTGLLFILRWFWWRVNATAELSAMIVSLLMAVYFQFLHEDIFHFNALNTTTQLIVSIILTTVSWLTACWFGKPTDIRVMASFVNKINPGGPGWKVPHPDWEFLLNHSSSTYWKLPIGIKLMAISTMTIYCILFGTGSLIMANNVKGTLLILAGVIGCFFVYKIWPKLNN